VECKADIGIVTALKVERAAILARLEEYTTEHDDSDPTTYFRGYISVPNSDHRYSVVLVELIDMGNGEAAISTTRMIEHYHPDYIFLVGIAGGVSKEVALGDVVVANFVYYYEPAKLTPGGAENRPQQFFSNRLLYGRSRNAWLWNWPDNIKTLRPGMGKQKSQLPTARYGPIASGEKVIANQQDIDDLCRQCSKLLAVAMEGYGVARAASNHNPPPSFLEVRGISDLADVKKDDKWHSYAADAAAAFVISLIRSGGLPKPVQTSPSIGHQEGIREPLASTPNLSLEVKREAVRQFLQSIEGNSNKISLFHTNEPIILSEQYIPIQVTLDRRYKHTVETAWSYAESEAELKRIYALKGGEEEIKRQQISWKDAKREHSRIVALADPGMGKSTLLRMEVSKTILDSLQVLDSGQPLEEIVIPLFIRLSMLVDEIIATSTEEAILDFIQNEYPNLLKHHENAEVLKFLNAFLKKQLLNNKCLLLLDALDEVSPEKRHQLLKKLNVFAKAYPTCPIVGTSRIVGYGGKLVDGAKNMEIVPFSQLQTEQYIETWFTNAQKHLKDQSVSAEGLIQALRDRPQIGGLAQNPLLLSLICSLYQQDKLTLPARRCQIYEKAVEYMLGEWRQTRQTPATSGNEAKIRLLEALAYHFTCKGQEVFKYGDLFDWIEEYLKSKKAPRDFWDVKTEELIADLSENDGILQKLYPDRDDKQYLFLHRTFQEYFTASYLSRMIKEDSSESVALVKQNLWKYDWHETLSLLAGVLEEPMPLIEAIVAEKDDVFQTQLLLAGRCIAECKQTNALIPLSSKIIEKILTFWRKYPDAEFIRSVVVAIGQNNSHICQRLQESLCDSDEDVRYRAIGALGKIGNDQALVALITALKNDLHEYVRRGAAQALGQIGNPQALEALINALNNDPHAYVRRGAAQALGQIGNPQALEALINALKNDLHEYVRRGAAQALGQIGNPQALEALITALKNDPHAYVRRGAAQALGQIGNEQALDPLINALKNDLHEYVRRGAIQALGQTGNPQAVEDLTNALNNDLNEYVRRGITQALGQIGNPQALEALINALNNDPHAYVRRGAAQALGQIGNEQALDPLITALNKSESDKGVRCMAAAILGRNGNSQAVDVLITALNDSDKNDSWLIVDALRRSSNLQMLRILIGLLSHYYEDVRNATTCYYSGQVGSAQAVDALIAALSDSDRRIRRMAADALGRNGNPQAVDALIAALNDSDKDDRWLEIVTLGRNGNPQSVDALIATLNDFDKDDRWLAIDALGQIDNSEVLAKILQSLEIDIYDSDIFCLTRTLAIRFSKDKKVGCIPVYPELVRKALST
jgi:HEAT repeat protein/nucleoside phosphorylase